jgi:magnesium transporter
MITIHRLEPRKEAGPKIAYLVQHQLAVGEPMPPDTIWVDLFEPTRDEQHAVELFAGISLPTPEEMDEIEPSELLYADDGARYMTARVMCLAKAQRPKIANISFIRKANTLVTVRYDDPKPFQTFAARAQRLGLAGNDAEAVFVGLIDAIVGRAAEILRSSGDHIDALSESIFEVAARKGRPETSEYQQTLATIGREGARISKARESMVSIELMLRFASADDEPRGGG